MCSSAQAYAQASSADDIARIVASLIKLLGKGGKLVREHEILTQIGRKIDDFGPYIKQLTDEDRIKLYLEVAEKKKLIKSTDKIKLHREILNGKYKKNDLVSMIRDNKGFYPPGDIPHTPPHIPIPPYGRYPPVGPPQRPPYMPLPPYGRFPPVGLPQIPPRLLLPPGTISPPTTYPSPIYP